MEFVAHTDTARFHSPLSDFDAVEPTVEVREDPLTGRTTRLVDDAFVTPDGYDIDAVVADDEGCFFCPENVTEATPTYADWVGEPRGTRGEATSFPNLTPYGAHSNVVALTEAHFQPIDAFTPRQFADGFALAFDYVGRVRDHDPDAAWASVNMNFLRSAGSSIVHPHCQALVGPHGTTAGRRLATASREYDAEHGRSYWRALVEAERGGERWIGETAGVEWLAPFAPAHHRQVLGVLGESDRPAAESDAVGGLADGLTAVLRSYAEAGLNAFNFALHLPPEPAMPPVFTVVARSVFDAYYWSDSTYFSTLHDESVIDTPPEDYAAAVRQRL